jgi:hypothetical protein
LKPAPYIRHAGVLTSAAPVHCVDASERLTPKVLLALLSVAVCDGRGAILSQRMKIEDVLNTDFGHRSRGGTEPGVTDADILLGYMGIESFVGGSLKVSEDAALAATTKRAASCVPKTLSELLT